jgi:hypothetical protein
LYPVVAAFKVAALVYKAILNTPVPEQVRNVEDLIIHTVTDEDKKSDEDSSLERDSNAKLSDDDYSNDFVEESL